MCTLCISVGVSLAHRGGRVLAASICQRVVATVPARRLFPSLESRDMAMVVGAVRPVLGCYGRRGSEPRHRLRRYVSVSSLLVAVITACQLECSASESVPKPGQQMVGVGAAIPLCDCDSVLCFWGRGILLSS